MARSKDAPAPDDQQEVDAFDVGIAREGDSGR
jgi:hypothetical protein